MIWWWDEIPQFYRWLETHPNVSKTLYSWTLRPEYGSLKSWGVIGNYDRDYNRIQRYAIRVPRGKREINRRIPC